MPPALFALVILEIGFTFCQASLNYNAPVFFLPWLG
jgi:hypothetical protein